MGQNGTFGPNSCEIPNASAVLPDPGAPAYCWMKLVKLQKIKESNVNEFMAEKRQRERAAEKEKQKKQQIKLPPL